LYEVRGFIDPRRLGGETQRLFIKNTVLVCGQWWSYDANSMGIVSLSSLGKVAFFCVTPTLAKKFQIMRLLKMADIKMTHMGNVSKPTH